MTASLHLLQQIVHGGADAIANLAAHLATTDEITVLVAAALLSPDADGCLARAAAAATTTGQRQLVAIADAHLRGESELVDALARDHLADHPSSILVAWISAVSHSPDTTHKDLS